MSETTTPSEKRAPRFHWRVFGVFLFLVIAGLIVAYLYSVEARNASEDALGRAISYKRTIVADYSRFYQCMQGSNPPASVAQATHPEPAPVATASTPAQPASPDSSPAATPPASAPAAAAATETTLGAAAGGPADSKPGAAGSGPSPNFIVYPPYPDYPAYPPYPGNGEQAAPARPGFLGGPPSAPPTPPQPAAGVPASVPSALPAPAPTATPSAATPSAAPPGPPQPTMAGGGNQPAVPMAVAPGYPAQGPAAPWQAPPQAERSPGYPGYGAAYPRPPEYAAAQAQAAVPQGPAQGSPGFPWQGVQRRGTPPAPTAAPPARPPEAAWSGPWQPQAAQNPAPAPWPSQGVPYGAAPATMPAWPMPQGPAQAPGQGAPAYPAQPQWYGAGPQAQQFAPYQGAPAAADPMLSSGRQASGGQRFQEALSSYRTLIAKGDDSPTVYGEMGNVLLAAGRQQEAAQAYYEASTRLIEMGQPGSAYLMLSYIETYDPLLGAILNRRLASLPRSLN